ncbi:MAG: MBL fold metallo-hydrolase [Chloroflexi bacterium]|nr:MBL fold metallo-hydrolase [Chloroflexota bacterium]
MDLTWYGGSCFRLRSSQVSILTDPLDLPPGAAPPPADIVTLSRRALRDRAAIPAGARLVDGPGESEVKGVPITGIAMGRRDGEAIEGSRAARNTVYSIVLDGVAVCHLGRAERAPSTQEVQDLGSPDVLLVPLGEGRGLSVSQAVTLGSQLEAKLLVPMLLGGPNEQALLERLCRELGGDPASGEPRLSVTSSGLPATTKVALLVPQEFPTKP